MSDNPNKREELHGVVEDALGFNLRSLKTLRDLIVRPRTVFAAYAARDRVTYTPAIRLFLGLVGLQVLISAIWGGWTGMLRRQIMDDPTSAEAFNQISNGRLEEFIQHYGDATGVVQPILVASFTALSVFVLGWLRRGLSWASRLNIAMGVLTAGSVFGLLMTPLLVFPGLPQLALISSLVVTVAYFLTFLRGAPGVLADTTAGAWGKAAIYATTLVLLVVVAGFFVAIVSAAYAIFRLNLSA